MGMIGRLHVGAGIVAGPVTWFPVWIEEPPPADEFDLVLDGSAPLIVVEADPPSVDALGITNVSAAPVWVLEGETFPGGMQDRVLASSVLLAPGEATRVPVHCVEAQRWAGSRAHTRMGRFAPLSVRGAMLSGVAEGSAQSRVWEAVAQRRRARGLGSPGASVREVLELAQALQASASLAGQHGVVVSIDGRVAALEVFASGRHYAACHRAILIAAAADAEGGRVKPCSARSARRFARAVSALSGMREPAPGLGGRLSASAEGVAASGACDSDGVAVHALALAA